MSIYHTLDTISYRVWGSISEQYGPKSLPSDSLYSQYVKETIPSTTHTIILFHASKSDSLDEMAKFLESHGLPKLTEEEIENLNSPITIKVIELIARSLPGKKTQGQLASLVKF